MSQVSRFHALPGLTCLILALLLSVQGCDCGSTGADVRRYACTQDNECASGFLCRQGECLPEEEPVDAGPDAGRPDAGPDGGTDGGTSGGTDGGTPDAGPTNRPTKLTFTSPPQVIQAGQCSAVVDLEARDSFGNPSPFSAQRTVTMAGANGSDFLFFSDAGCTSQIAQAVFAAGASRTSLYFKGRTGGTFDIIATASGLPSASQSETILPVVRTGTCTIALGDGSVTCPITPAQLDLSKTLLMFQTSSNDANPGIASVRCRLTALNAITCTRQDFGGGDEPPVDIRWQTAELASGLKVQHLQADCNVPSPLISVPIQPVANVQTTFLLVSSESSGSTFGDDNFYTAWLNSSSLVELAFNANCDSEFVASIQVVELTGASVTRGFTQPLTGNSRNVANQPSVNIDTTALLFTYQSSASVSAILCDRVVRGELSSATALSFTRGSNSAACTNESIPTIAWERIDFGSRAQAQHFQVSMASGTTSTLVTIPLPVDPTRTLVFATGQAQAGQGGGDSNYSGDDTIGASVGVHALSSPTSFAVSRGSSSGTTRWISTVLQLDP